MRVIATTVKAGITYFLLDSSEHRGYGDLFVAKGLLHYASFDFNILNGFHGEMRFHLMQLETSDLFKEEREAARARRIPTQLRIEGDCDGG